MHEKRHKRVAAALVAVVRVSDRGVDQRSDLDARGRLAAFTTAGQSVDTIVYV